MDELHRQIDDHIAEEHRLRAGQVDDEARTRLAAIEIGLDQLWDLLRRRDARRAVGANPDGVHERPANEVESYLQ